MSSIPSVHGRSGRLVTIPGMVPTIETMPAGCRFSTRCPFVEDACLDAPPPLAEVAPGHAAACINIPLEAKIKADAA